MKNLLRKVGAVLALAASSALSFADTTWSSTAQNLWANPADWSSGLPNGSSGAIFQDLGSNGLVHSIDVSVQNTISRCITFAASTAGNGFTIFSSTVPSIMQLNANATAGVPSIVNYDTRAQTINVPLKLYSPNGFSGSGAAQTWTAASGNLFITGAYRNSGTPPATVDNNGGRLTIDGAFNTTIGAANGNGIMTGGGGLTKMGSGTLFLGGTNANTFSGGTILSAGAIAANKANVLGSGGLSMTVGTAFQLNDLNQSLGALTVLSSGGPAGAGAAIDFGPSQSSACTLSFASSSSSTWSAGLTILDWDPTKDKLRFGTSASGLTALQLSEISFDGFGAAQGYGPAQIDASGFITVVPEPAALSLCLLGGLALALRRNARPR